MLGYSNLEIEVQLDGGWPESMGRDVREGLTGSPKSIPCKYFYDERGSRLFEQITELPEYYLTRSEQALLERHAAEMAQLARPEELVELGSGSAKKSLILIDAALASGSLRRYVPVDAARAAVEGFARELAEIYPELEIHAVVGDFEQELKLVPNGTGRMTAFLGSTIGNFTEPQAVAFLSKVAKLLGRDDWFVLGTDLVKDEAVLEAAYNDSQGVTAEFNRNILNVVNRHLEGDFDPRQFEHVAFYNAAEARIESYLRSTCEQAVRLKAIDLDVRFGRGEMLWTEVSCKYTRDSVERILDGAGLRLAHWYAAPDGSFALSLSRVKRGQI